MCHFTLCFLHRLKDMAGIFYVLLIVNKWHVQQSQPTMNSSCLQVLCVKLVAQKLNKLKKKYISEPHCCTGWHSPQKFMVMLVIYGIYVWMLFIFFACTLCLQTISTFLFYLKLCLNYIYISVLYCLFMWVLHVFLVFLPFSLIL